ncbi:hypothetical protein VOLCADRAFT_88428 [Volvox carteri f. nagariensis]|uniref:tRNA pseudouridine(55) synthase n=1 Tax=Volvox carteri f. nagariensis TaxID=3068 RepID=D8TNZ0_VOLCA|nr:uncharacterized protein VOLCADRAFT_88428 [Volvox carteri f. nagariensis]EFJ50668.1 hypothetical protein VOLCADRAFT_88428 [Volvox carteri f. nagariensis]|eukprot:XP_002948261.1 hypothetical protein VOLCADRAFT_88428 [Volvox carteri f. nagariensis]
MAAGGRKQIDVLKSAVGKLAGRFEAENSTPFFEAAASLARDGLPISCPPSPFTRVCSRCLLRVAGHMGMEDYTLTAPSQGEIIFALSPHDAANAAVAAAAAAAAGSSDVDGGEGGPFPPEEATTAAGLPLCPTCFGLLPALLDKQRPALPTHGTAADGNQRTAVSASGDAAAANATAAAATAAAATAAGTAGTATGGVDLAWLRVQKAVSDATGCRAGPAANHERLQDWPSIADIADAVRRQAEVGPPDSIALAAATAAAVPAAPPPPPSAADSGDVAMAEAASAAKPTTASATSEVVVGPPLQLKSFSLEINTVPAATAVRDVSLHAWLISFCESRGVRCPAWRPTDIVSLPTVLRRVVPLCLSRQLGVPAAGHQSAAVCVSVAILDGGEGLQELRVLAEQQGGGGRRQQQHHFQHYRQNKRQRGPQGRQQQQQLGPEQDAAEGEGEGGLQGKAFDERNQLMSFEQASTAACSTPRHVLARLFPWPPLPADKRRELQQQQQKQQPHYQQQQRYRHGRPVHSPRAAAAAAAPADNKATEPAAAAAAPPRVFVRAVHAPILLAGSATTPPDSTQTSQYHKQRRYCKLRRHMPQCPWFVLSTGARIAGVSVQEVIEQFVLPVYGTCTAKMITGGREDADVRMLGPGRPFVLELQVSPKELPSFVAPRQRVCGGVGRPYPAPLRGHPPVSELRRLEARMRDSKCGVTVQGLTPCGPAALESIKAAEELKEKSYRALCWAERAPSLEDLEALKALGRVEAAQDTPVRVLHRRAAKVRPKWFQVELAIPVSGRPNYFVLEFRTQVIDKTGQPASPSGASTSPLSASPSISPSASPPPPVDGAADGTAKRKFNPKPRPRPPNKPDSKPELKSSPKPNTTSGPAPVPVLTADMLDSGSFVRVEIVQLDVIDVHLDKWP